MLDLYQEQIAETLKPLKPIQDVEPGIWANFASGAGNTAMQGFAKAARAGGMALSAAAVLEDKYYGGTTAQDRFFKWHDEVLGRAVDYWTPKPNEVGVAGEVVGSLLSMLPMVFASPAAAVATTQLGTAEDLVRRHPDLSPTKANVVGGIQGAGLGLGIWMPILGRSLTERVLVGGAGFNVLQGAVMRGVSGEVLEGTKAAEEFKAFDPKALTIDVLLGLAFGMGAHFIPSQRQQGAEAWKAIEAWAKGLKPSEIDALMVLREAQHINEDSLPGKPATGADVSAHVDRVRQALDQTLRDEPINVQDIKVSRGVSEETSIKTTETGAYPTQIDAPESPRDPQFTVDSTRVNEAERTAAMLQAEAERVRLEEGLPRVETQVVRPPADITPLDAGAQARAVGQHIENQLIQSGMARKEAVANAAIWEAFAKSAHERYGVTPAELMAKWGVDVRRMDSADKLLGPLESRYDQPGGGPMKTLIDAIGHDDAAGLVMNWNDSELSKSGRITQFAGRERNTARDEFNGKTQLPQDEFVQWLFSDRPLSSEYQVDAEWRAQIQRAREALREFDPNNPNILMQSEFQLKGETAEEIKAREQAEAEAIARGEQPAPKGKKVTADQLDMFNTQHTLFQSEQPWYSELARQVGYLKVNEAPAKGWKDTIKGLVNKGLVKQAEIDATGFNEWLDLQNGKVTKQQVEDFIAQNGVRVEEVKLGTPESKANVVDALARLEAAGFRVEGDQYFGAMLERNGASVDDAELTAQNRADLQTLNENDGDAPLETGNAKFSQYQLPGGQNYRELLLTLPTESAERTALIAEREAMAKAGMFLQGNPNYARDHARYEEINQRLMEIEFPQPFRSSHFDQPNILAHIRFNERTDADGKKVLFIEEIQSDWAQKGKREGFKGPEVVEAGAAPDFRITQSDHQYHVVDPVSGLRVDIGKGTVESEQSARDYAERYFYQRIVEKKQARAQGVPKAPFVEKTEAWVGLTLKRMIRYAAENGFDRVAWTTGEQQVARYTHALRSQVDALEWKKTKDGVQLIGYKGRANGTMQTDAALRGEVNGILINNDYLGFDTLAQARSALLADRADWQDRWEVNTPEEAEAIQRWLDSAETIDQRTKVVDTTEKESVLSDAIGKSMADKIRSDPNESGIIEGENIKIDDTGMATFYDRIVRNVANDLLKKMGGGKVGQTAIGETKRAGEGSVEEIPNLDGSGFHYIAYGPDGYRTGAAFETRAEAEVAAGATERTKQPAFDLTPAMIDKALSGMPLFQGNARGAVSFDTGRTLIGLFEKADKSTFQHETGHVFLEMTKDLASRQDAPVGAVQDWATIANWLKIEGGEITRDAHEQWARGWEKYLAEGVAPNEGLKNAFRRFRDWLIDIYKSLVNIDAPLNNQIRGVMARMLESQAKDPIAKGGLDDPRLQDPEYRDALNTMASRSGWAQEGGKLMRTAHSEVSGDETITRTTWIPYEEWYQRMQQDPKTHLAPSDKRPVEIAVRKAIMGEKMSVNERRAVIFMLDEHKIFMDAWAEAHAEEVNPVVDPYAVSNALHGEGLPETPNNLLNMALIDRARQLDPEALENIPTNSDDAQFMAAVKEIVDAHQRRIKAIDQGGEETAQTEQVAPQDQAGGGGHPPPPDAAGESPGAAAGMLANEARRIAAENPDIRVNVGSDERGNPVYRTLNEILDDAAAETEMAMQDIQLLAVAAECLLGVA